MIDEVLLKFSQSEARRVNPSKTHLLSSTPRKSAYRTPSKTSAFPLASTDSAHSPKKPAEPKSKLQKMVQFLKQCNGRRCSLKEHDFNKMKYVCLEDSCGNNIGCAHCFLHHHVGHAKAQINICIRDIEDLERLMNKSYEKITLMKQNLRDQVLQEIDMEISNLCNDFHSNLQFFKNKAIKEIDTYLLHHSAAMESMHEQESILTQEQLLVELIRLDIRGIERDLYEQLRETEHQKYNVIPIIKVFQQMNGSMNHFMAEFKKCFPKLYPMSYQAGSAERSRVVHLSDRWEDGGERVASQSRGSANYNLESPHFQT